MKRAIREFEEYRERAKERKHNPPKILKVNWSTSAENAYENLCKDTTPLVVSIIFEMMLEQLGRVFDPDRDDLMDTYQGMWVRQWADAAMLQCYEVEILNDAGVTAL